MAVVVLTLAACSTGEATTSPSSSPAPATPAARATDIGPDGDHASEAPLDEEGHDEDGHDDLEVEAPELPTWDERAAIDAAARAEGFVRAWARPELDAAAWLAGVQGFLTPSAAEGYVWTDPTTVPATEITGPGTVVEGTATSAVVRVRTDAGDHDVQLVRAEAGAPWLVASLTPAPPEGSER
ncbi:hypothetical protein [Cellulomonas sp. HD19AZ1]|uniref:hypothetical protein n=1 Tax=Cellulomonas sp. HD19AZ1 TaxID=2559593 RepID=UPI0010710A05|nr:hypothetical protein [Cellulomonas sp. HD19AZ1]TFH68156.1 hypothetical protein E4A51_18095 [Cellulomonas sp. HD19AZ1]